MLGAESLGVSEIARRLDVDKAGVSRMLAQLHAEGWVLRTGARYVLGERALGLLVGQEADLRDRAQLLAAALHRETGLAAGVVRLAGTGTQPLAMRSEDDAGWLDPPEPFEHLWSTAAGLALLAQLPDADVAQRLEVTPWPAYADGAPDGPDQVWEIVRAVRSGAAVEERGWTIPGIGCAALPWPVPEPGPPVAALVLGPVAAVGRDAVRRALRNAVQGSFGGGEARSRTR